jgi:hypothetical protein
LGIVAAHARLTLASRTTLVPVVRREPERQQLLFHHGAARVVPEAVDEEFGLPYSKIRVIPSAYITVQFAFYLLFGPVMVLCERNSLSLFGLKTELGPRSDGRQPKLAEAKKALGNIGNWQG